MNLALANAAFRLFVKGYASPTANKWRWPCSRALWAFGCDFYYPGAPPGSRSANFRKLGKTSNLKDSWILFVVPHAMTFSLETGLAFK